MIDNGRLEQLAIEVASGQSVRDAAKTLSIPEGTAYKLSASIEFRTRLNELRSEAFQAALSKLSAVASEAVDTLREMLDATQRPADRINAAKAILANVAPLSDHVDLRERIAALEATRPVKVPA